MNKQYCKPLLKPTPVQWLCWLAMGAVSVSFNRSQAQTNIVADPKAPRSQQASVIRSGNNITQVNIQTPSAAGVSRNTYTQFDIGRDSAILNNSSTHVQTEIGGWVQANPWLATGGARVILNEVNSPSPSQLKGFIEVAGQRAEVVIANPSGISVNGGGFINASRVHLTTGTPVMNAGNIDSFRVQSGTVSIDGQGLDNRTVDYTAILSRALQLNAGIWASELKVVTGSNQVTASSLAPDMIPVATAISGGGSKPAFALDVSQLGGMYAGKIHLIGTEAGLGVRNAGSLQANSGPLVLNQNGWLTNSGYMRSSQNMPITANGSVENSGSIVASGNLSIQSKGTQTHSGSIISTDALTLKSDSIDLSQGTVNAKQASITALSGDVNATASRITVSQNFNIQTQQTLITDSASVSTNTLDLQAKAWRNVDGSVTHTGARDLNIHLDGDFDNTRGVLKTNSNILSLQSDRFINSGLVFAAADLNINTRILENQGSLVARNNQSIQTQTMTGTDGSLIAAGMTNEGKLQANPTGSANLNITGTQSLQNTGQVLAYGDLQLSGSSIDLRHSQTASQTGSLSLTAREGDINTSNAVISSPGNISISANQHTGQGLINQSGNIRGNSLRLQFKSLDNSIGTIAQTGNTQLDIDLDGGTFDNSQGLLVNKGNVSVQASKVINQQGTIGSQTGSVNISSRTGGINNTQGLISAQQQLVLQTNGAGLTNTNTTDAQHRYGIQAGGSANIQSGALDNSTGYINANGLTVTAASVDNISGRVLSNSNTTLSSASLDNRRGQWLSVGDMGLKIDNLDNSSQGSIRSAGALSLQADGAFNNATGELSATTDISIDAWKANTPSLSIDNSGGVIKSDGSMRIKASKLKGSGSVESGTQAKASGLVSRQAIALESARDMAMAIELQDDYTTQGTMRSAGNLSLKTTGKLTNNKTVSAGNDLTVAAANIDNQVDGEFISGNTTSVTASNDFTNRGLVDGSHTQISSHTLTNLGTGRIYGDRISITANTLTNKEETLGNTTTAATIASRNDLDIGAQNLVNQEHALIYSDGNMSIAGALDANRRATGRADSLTNSSATIEAGNDLSISSASLHNMNLHYSIERDRQVSQSGQMQREVGSRVDNWTEWLFYITAYQDFLVSSDPAKIIAGRDLGLNISTGQNFLSHLISGGINSYTGNNITNDSPLLYSTQLENGTSMHRWRVEDGCLFNRCWYRWTNDPQPTPYSTTLSTTSAPASQAFQSTNFTSPSANTPKLNGLSAGQSVTPGTTTSLGNASEKPTFITPQKVNVSPVLEIRSASLPQSLPSTSLYKTRPDPTAKFLVETDPRFTNQKNWLSSDYMLKSMALDPSIAQKRIGDGFFEQKLIREQVAQLTGRRFIGDYTNDEQQYQALMNNALTTAQALNLRPGIALSPAQMALLTSDIVWLVEQNFMLPDGSKQSVLVPQLYVRVKPGDLDGSGALIAGDSININLTGELNNSGTIAGRKLMNITAENIRNKGGTLSADKLNAVARLDIDNTGGTIEALSAANLAAGRDFNMTTTTQSSATASGLSNVSQTGVDRVAALYVKNPGGTLTINAGRDINLTAAKVESQGSAILTAGNNINLGTVNTEQTNNLVVDANNYNLTSSSKDIGSNITTANMLTLNAGNDLNAKAATVQAGNALNVNAGNDITIVAGESKQSSASATKTTSNGFLTSTTTTTQSSSASNKAIASTFSGNSTSIVANNNLTSVGTAFKGKDSLVVEGKNEQKFYEAVDQSSSTNKTESSSSLLGFTVDKGSNTDSQSKTTALGSKLISDKAIQVNVGNSAEFKGAEITAPQTTFNNIDPNKPGTVTLGGATETTQTMRSSSSETAGVWQSLSDGGSTTQTMKQTTINGDVKFDDKLKVIVQLPYVVNTSGNTPNEIANSNGSGNSGSIVNVNQSTVQSQIETLSQQPGLGYLKQFMEGNAGVGNSAASTETGISSPKVQWQQVILAHNNWNYSHEGLTPAGAALLAIAVAAYAPGLNSGLVSTVGGSATGLNAGFAALQAQAAVAMANNGGDIGKTLKQLGSEQSIKSLLTTMVTASALQAMNTAIADASNTANKSSTYSVVANNQNGDAISGLNGFTTSQTASAFTHNFTRNLTNNMAAAVVDSAISNKPLNADTLANTLKSSLITSGMASGANAIGDATKNADIDTFTQKVAHAVLGCVGGATSTGHSGACSPGAVGAVVGEMAADYYMNSNEDPKLSLEQNKANALAFAKVMSAASGIVAGGGGEDVAAVNVAGMTGANAAENNYLLHNKLKDEEGELRRLKKQKASAQCDAACNTRIQELETLDKLRDEQLAPLIAACEKAGRNNCKGEAIAKNFAQANGFGAESMKRESNAGTLGSPFSFNNCPSSDKGGCSYGPLQIAADTGMMNAFIEGLKQNPSEEAQSFYKQLQAAGGVSASQNKDPAFIKTWMQLTSKDPQFVQYQIDALVNENLYPVVQELQKVGVDFNKLTSSQKEALFSAAVQHGAGTKSKTKGADNVMERAISVAQTDAEVPSFPTYTRQELVYGQVEDQMRAAEETQNKLGKQRESLITQRESLITQQLKLERQKSQLLEKGMGASSEDVQRIQTQVKALDKKISTITEQVTPITTKVDGITNQISAQNKYIQEAAQYLKSQAQGSLADGEQWLKDFYEQRTQMYPSEAARYKKELDSLLKQYREEQKAKQKKR